MRQNAEVARRLSLSVLLMCLSVFIIGIAAAETESSDAANRTAATFLRNYDAGAADTESDYPLFRSHRERYYPALDTAKAARLSTFMPGLGQAYARDYKKATAFLTAELATFALAGYNIARALHYNEQRVYETGFQDPRTGKFLTYEQGRTRMQNHVFFSGVFLAAGIGIHIWNILDAPKTAAAYNDRRFAVQVEQRETGLRSVIFIHRF